MRCFRWLGTATTRAWYSFPSAKPFLGGDGRSGPFGGEGDRIFKCDVFRWSLYFVFRLPLLMRQGYWSGRTVTSLFLHTFATSMKVIWRLEVVKNLVIALNRSLAWRDFFEISWGISPILSPVWNHWLFSISSWNTQLDTNATHSWTYLQCGEFFSVYLNKNTLYNIFVNHIIIINTYSVSRG